MQLQTFNQLCEQDAHTILKHCVTIESWINAMVKARPYANKQDLLQQAQQHAINWQWQEIKQALDQHPKIGEQKAKTELSEQEQHYSSREQANIQLTPTQQKQLQLDNLAYQQKFGFIFLIKAFGLSQEEIFQQLQQRLTHNLNTEKQVVHQNLQGIALLRLDQEIQE